MSTTVFSFRETHPLIGVVHVSALPGAPGYAGSMTSVVERAVRDARVLADAGFHGLIVENYGDAPFFATTVPPETVAALTRCVSAIVDAASIPVGVNVLRNDPFAALAIAAATGARFIRVNVHVGAAWTDQGLITGRAAETVRMRSRLAIDTAIFADVDVKHAAPVAPRPLPDVALDCALRGKADALVLTGPATGRATDTGELEAVRAVLPDLPLFAGSGVTEETVARVLHHATGVIVGTTLKEGGAIGNPVDVDRARRFVAAATGE